MSIPPWLFDLLAEYVADDRELVARVQAWSELLIGARELIGTEVTIERETTIEAPTLRPCAPDCDMAPGTFHDGPLDGQRPRIPKSGPAWIRLRDAAGTHWYAHRRQTKRTYEWVGVS